MEKGESTLREDNRAEGQQSPQLEDARREYRGFLVNAYQGESEAYDKAVMTLSAGALGVSITFIHDIVQSPRKETLILLAIAWGSFALSILAILTSMLTSQKAIRKAILQLDHGTIDRERPGAWYGRFTAILNLTACVGFILGVVFLVWFSLANLSMVAHSP